MALRMDVMKKIAKNKRGVIYDTNIVMPEWDLPFKCDSLGEVIVYAEQAEIRAVVGMNYDQVGQNIEPHRLPIQIANKPQQ